MPDQKTGLKKRESFDVDKIPEKTRRIIRVAVLAVIMVVISAVWLPLAIKNISENSAKGSGELSGVGKDLEIFLDELKTKSERIGEGFQDNANDEQKGRDQVKDGVAEVLNDQLTTGWLEYNDLPNRFIIKYPNNFNLNTSSDSIFRLSRIGTTTPVLEIKKFSSYGSLTNMINIKKIIQRPDHLFVFLDYDNSTTTNLIINSFKLIDNNL